MRPTKEFNDEKSTRSFDFAEDIPVEPVPNYSAAEFKLPARYWVFVDAGLLSIDEAVAKYQQELKISGAEFDPLG